MIFALLGEEKLKQPTKKHMMQFRPSDTDKRTRAKYRREMPWFSFDWHSRTPSIFSKKPSNNWFMGGIVFAKVHYLISHAPKQVVDRNKQLSARWSKKLLASKRITGRFVNKFTIHRWI